MVESIYYLDLLDKMTDMPIAKTLLLKVFLHCNLLSQPSAQEYLTVATSTDWLDNLDLIFRDEKSELDALLFQVCRNFRLHAKSIFLVFLLVLLALVLSFSSV